MDTKTKALCIQELEVISSRLLQGDLTPLVFDVLMNTTDLPGLLKYLGDREEIPTRQESPETAKTAMPSFSKLFAASKVIGGK